MRAEYGLSHAFMISLWRFGRNGRLTGDGRLCPERNRSSSLLRATPPFPCLHSRSNLTVARSITSSSSSYVGQTGWESSEITSLPSSAHSCLGASKWQYILLQQFTLVSHRWAREINSSLKLVSKLHLQSPWSQSHCCLNNGWAWAAGGRWLPQFSWEKVLTRDRPIYRLTDIFPDI